MRTKRNLRSSGEDEGPRKRLRSSNADALKPTKANEKHGPVGGQRKEDSNLQNPSSSSGCSSSTPSTQDEMKQSRPQTRVERYGSLKFDSEESEDSDEELPTEEEVKKTEGWGILMKAMYEKYGRKSVVHKSTS